jgi:hypothetical protein
MKVLWPGWGRSAGQLCSAGSAQYVDERVSIGTQLVRPESTQSSIFEFE